jgi:uncharacterized protein (DUF2062 family)
VRAISEQLRTRLRRLVGLNESADRLATAWAVGVAIGLSPFIGLHTVVGLLLAFAFRLNKVDVLLGTLVVNPWTRPPYFAWAVVFGQWITGIRVGRIQVPELSLLLSAHAWHQHSAWLRPLLHTWMAGAGVTCLVGGLATYLLVRRFIHFHRRREQERRTRDVRG